MEKITNREKAIATYQALVRRKEIKELKKEIAASRKHVDYDKLYSSKEEFNDDIYESYMSTKSRRRRW